MSRFFQRTKYSNYTSFKDVISSLKGKKFQWYFREMLVCNSSRSVFSVMKTVKCFHLTLCVFSQFLQIHLLNSIVRSNAFTLKDLVQTLNLNPKLSWFAAPISSSDSFSSCADPSVIPFSMPLWPSSGSFCTFRNAELSYNSNIMYSWSLTS